MRPKTQNLYSQKIAGFLHFYDLSVEHIYKVRWEYSNGFWRPCLKCLRHNFIELYDPCPKHPVMDQNLDFIRRDIEVLRMIDFITLEFENLQKE